MAAPQQLSPIFGLPRRVGLVVGAVLVADQATKALAQQQAAPDAPGWLQPAHNPDVLMSVYSDTPALLVASAREPGEASTTEAAMSYRFRFIGRSLSRVSRLI